MSKRYMQIETEEGSTWVKPTQRWVVGVYEIDRAYGGPEEGGWWFGTGKLELTSKVFKNEDDAYAYCRRGNHLMRFFQGKNRYLRDISSVIYDGGRLQYEVHKDSCPPFYPEVRPHYE